MKFSTSLLILLLFTTLSFAQEAKDTNPISTIKSLEKEIKTKATDKETISLFEREREVSKKLKARQEELLRQDQKYQDLKKDLDLAIATKVSALKKQSPEYATAYNKLEQLENEKKITKEKKAEMIANRKAEAAAKKEKKKAEMAAKKAKKLTKKTKKEK